MRAPLLALTVITMALSVGPAMAAGLVTENSCPSGYVFTPIAGIVSNGFKVGYCKPPEQGEDACSSAPTIAITDYWPEEIRARSSKFVGITISGQIALPKNCTIAGATYRIVDEYGNGHASGSLDVRDGEFSTTAPVMVSHRKSDNHGRLYRIIVEAKNEFGKGTSAPASVVVIRNES